MAALWKPRRPGRRLRRTVAWTLIGLVLAVAGVGTWLYQHLNGSIRSVDIHAELGTDRPEEDPEQPAQDVLVLGTDSGTGAEPATGEESAMVLHVPGDGSAPTLVQIPRGTLLDRPDCAGSGDPAPLGEIHEEGGASCVVRTVERFSDIRMDHYLEVDFAGLGEVVDALGGITVTFDQPVVDDRGDQLLAAGRHTLDGATAQHTVREGRSATGSDLRQQLLLATLDRAGSENVLSHPTRIYRVADAAAKSLTTDSELASLSDLLDFAKRLSGLDAERLTTLALPVKPVPGPGGSAEGAVPRQPQADGVWEALRGGGAVPPAAEEG